MYSKTVGIVEKFQFQRSKSKTFNTTYLYYTVVFFSRRTFLNTLLYLPDSFIVLLVFYYRLADDDIRLLYFLVINEYYLDYNY